VYIVINDSYIFRNITTHYENIVLNLNLVKNLCLGRASKVYYMRTQVDARLWWITQITQQQTMYIHPHEHNTRWLHKYKLDSMKLLQKLIQLVTDGNTDLWLNGIKLMQFTFSRPDSPVGLRLHAKTCNFRPPLAKKCKLLAQNSA